MNNNNNKSESIISKIKDKLSGNASQKVFDLEGNELGEFSSDGSLTIDGKKVSHTVVIDKE